MALFPAAALGEAIGHWRLYNIGLGLASVACVRQSHRTGYCSTGPGDWCGLRAVDQRGALMRVTYPKAHLGRPFGILEKIGINEGDDSPSPKGGNR